MPSKFKFYFILFFILRLGNSDDPLIFNFLGEFMCLHGAFERLPIISLFAASFIILFAAYTLYMYNIIAFGIYK